LIAAASVTEMMVMITLRDAQSSIVERDHWSIDFVARTHQALRAEARRARSRGGNSSAS
jgi:hypothetical protein